MSSTLTVRLSAQLLDRVRRLARRTGLPVGQVVRESIEKTLAQEGGEQPPWTKYVGVIKGGPRNLSSRKGFSRE